jgi:hypothetical protein
LRLSTALANSLAVPGRGSAAGPWAASSSFSSFGFVVIFYFSISYFFIAILWFVIVKAEPGVVVVDGGEGAEKETANVGEDGGTAGRNAAFGKEF